MQPKPTSLVTQSTEGHEMLVPSGWNLGTGTFPGLRLPGDQRRLEHEPETKVLTWMRLHDPREPLADPAGPAINSTGDWLLGRSFYLLFQTAIVMHPRDKKPHIPRPELMCSIVDAGRHRHRGPSTGTLSERPHVSTSLGGDLETDLRQYQLWCLQVAISSSSLR